jgi:DNA-directed RNA polymerase III subunit RPC4
MVKPTFTGRRSKEERAALEKEALDRERARTKEREDADRKKRTEADKKAKRDAERATRGRGGYTGAMSGPFSLGSSREGKSQDGELFQASSNAYHRSENQSQERLGLWLRVRVTGNTHQK